MADLISPDELRGRQQAGQDVTVIDVRGADEYAAGHLPGALHIPGDELPARLASIARDRPVVTY